MTIDLQIKPDEVKSLSTLVADRLTELIQSGGFKPGQHLVQTELAKQFGVSRVAIREALHKLLKRGLAINIPLKGMIVRPVSGKSIRELFAIRQVLEGLAVREACTRLTPKDLQQVEAALREQQELAEQGDIDGVLTKDWQFHASIYCHCDNEALLEIISNVWARIRQARGLARENLSWGRKWAIQSVRRHRKILSALKERNPQRAAEFTIEAIQLALEELMVAVVPQKQVPEEEAG